jgi:UDP-N-acetylmuramyl pentapeptide phosphotransferase/UDP-N-acetylglucosamine-1-phosphate transferase
LSTLAILGAAFLVSLIICRLMIGLGPKDMPDGGRKTQAVPVPSSGGIGIVTGIAAGMALLGLLGAAAAERLFSPPLAGITGFVLMTAVIGWLDDAKGLAAKTKLLVLLAGSWGAVLAGLVPQTLWISGEGISLPWLVAAGLAALWIFVMSNAVNFMDGANGIAMGTALIILCSLALMLAPAVSYSPDHAAAELLVWFLLAGAAAIGGFLFWNLRGLLFAGDAGALSIGGLIGGASVMFAMAGPILVPLTLCLPILIDVFMTLAWRAMRGLPLMQAHRDHAYQLLLRSGWSHSRVARLWWVMTAFCAGGVVAGPLAVSAGAYSAGRLPVDVLVFAVFAAAGVVIWTFQRLTLGRKLEAQ